MKPHEIESVFQAQGGNVVGGFPVIDALAYQTSRGTSYLQDPGVVVLAHTRTNPEVLKGFLAGFDPALEFPAYLHDPVCWDEVDVCEEQGRRTFVPDPAHPLRHPLPDSAQLVKIAGQLCYMSFGPDRTRNAEAVKYLTNLVASGHGSVLEHPNVTLLLYGISRSLTHELVRHRAGFGYSQLSQRYVDGSRLRFVERPEYQQDGGLHSAFQQEIDRQAEQYELLAQHLLARQEQGSDLLAGETKRDRRKKVNQAARSVLGNHAEAPIVVTGNLRAWRHVLSMRASEHAEVEIRRAAYRCFLCLAMLDPVVFRDYDMVTYADGTKGVTTPYPKV